MRLIDADKAKQIVFEYMPTQIAYEVVCKILDRMPRVEAEPIRHGHWKIIDQDVMGCKKYRCELCGAVTEAYSLDNIHYCGGCGAKMDEVTEDV